MYFILIQEYTSLHALFFSPWRSIFLTKFLKLNQIIQLWFFNTYRCNKGTDVELTDLSYYCYDYDTRGNWATGGNTFVVDVPGKKKEFHVR